jgi:hypothetical protein
MRLTKKEREKLRAMFDGKCAYCGCELGRGWCADHIEPIYRQWWINQKWWKEKHLVKYEFDDENQKMIKTELHPQKAGVTFPERDTKENLFPCCRPCNIHKGASTLDEWRAVLFRVTEILTNHYPTYRHAVRFGRVIEHKGPIVFWFETFKENLEGK